MHLTVIKNESCKRGFELLLEEFTDMVDDGFYGSLDGLTNGMEYSGGRGWLLRITGSRKDVIMDFSRKAESLGCKYEIEVDGRVLHKEEVKDLLNQLDSGRY